MATIQNVTVLFTDLVGSTELVSTLSPEAGDEVRRMHFSALRQAIAASGGTEVKNLGDGLMVVFPAASAALGCAVAMQQVVHRSNAGTERPLRLRVGLSSGESTKEDGDYFGDPVIEAARLCARADGGQILASELVRANAGRRSSHTFTSLGELELKGLPDPIETLDVAWEPLGPEAPGSGRAPLPTRLTHRPAMGMIGRRNELAILAAATKRVGCGNGRELILMTGEPGQGKTTLVSEVARQCYDAEMTVLLGRCDEEVDAPYRSFRESLSHLVTHVDEEVLRTHVFEHGGELARMVPALGQRLGELPSPQTSDAETERYLLYAAVVGLLDTASRQRPVVLVLDDLHWADKPSLQLLRHLVANTSLARLLILGTYRAAELSASHPLNEALAAWHREPTGVSTIDLKGLEDTEVIAFLESAAGHELDDAGVRLAHQLYRETDGNPFFVGEVLRHLSESGAIYQDTATRRWAAKETEGQLALPHSVRTVIGTRVARLGGQATKILSTASVIGRDFDLDLLAETAQVDEDNLMDLLKEAERAALVTEFSDTPGRYSFSHALIQHTLYEDLGPTRRTRAHRSVGEAIERLSGQNQEDRLAELARHFFLATRPMDTEKAISYARRAGEAALKALAPDDAVRYFSQALGLTVQTGDREPALYIDLLIGLGTAERQAGIAEYREHLLEAARQASQINDSDHLVDAALANNRGFFSALGVIDTERVEMLETSLALLPETDSSNRAKLLARLCSELAFGALDRRLALARESKAVARSTGDAATIIQVLFDCGAPLRIPDGLQDRREEWDEAVQLADLLQDPLLQLWAAAQGVIEETRGANFVHARHHLTQLTQLAHRLQQPMWLWYVNYVQASYALLHGEPLQAEKLANAALEIGTASGQPDATVFYGTQLMMIRNQQGRMGELVELIADVADQTPGIPTYRAVLATAYLQAGEAEHSRRLVEEALVDSFALPMDTAWLDGIVMYARPTIELRISSAAEVLMELLAPYHSQVPNNGLIPQEPVSMFLGGLATVAGRYKDAEAYFMESAELNQRGEMHFSEAHTNLLWGRLHLQRGETGDPQRARELLEQAREKAASRGYVMIERGAIEDLSKLY
ncbi:MAG TPA: AAA family ATPase [Acidimicrobiales bacterium]|nr:AAA family ATPase [Acidimicrobiales bacterium]